MIWRLLQEKRAGRKVLGAGILFAGLAAGLFALDEMHVARLEDDVLICVEIELYLLVPVGAYLARLLDDDVVEHVVDSAVLPGLGDGRVRERLMIADLTAVIEELVVAADAAARKRYELEDAVEILQNGVVRLVIEVFRRGLGIVHAELDGKPEPVAEAADEMQQLICINS